MSRRPASDPPAEETAAASIESIWERFGGELRSRVQTLEEALAALVESRLDEELRRQAERDAHRLAGSAGTFGRRRASVLARSLEELFSGPGSIHASAIPGALEDLENLRSELSGPTLALSTAAAEEVGAPVPPSGSPPSGSPPSGQSDAAEVLIVCRDPESAAAIAMAAGAWGLRGRVAAGVEAARRALGESRPAAALVDLSFGEASAVELVRVLTSQSPPVVPLAMVGKAAFMDRVEAVRAGVRAFVDETLPPSELIGAVAASLEAEQGDRWQLVAVDDDPMILAALQALLEPAGLRVRGLGDPKQFWAALDETAPDLAVLDLDMPHASGIELCRLLRADTRWATLPVVVLTARVDRATIEAVFAAGADDFVVKPVMGPELLTRIRNRLERTRMLRTLAEVDPLTGLANRRTLEARWARLQAMADRYGQPLSFVLLDLDAFRGLNNRYGHDVGDAALWRLANLLTERFRGEDVVGRWGGEEFALALYGMTSEDGVRRVNEALAATAELELGVPGSDGPRISFSAGVSQYRRDADSLRELYLLADEVLYQAKGLGPGSVVATGQRLAERSSTDVAVVEDDDVLAELLAHGLRTRGYSSVRLIDGNSAVERLTGPARLSAGVILLDISLPELDGFAVLDRLRHDGVLEHSRVIVLTARSSEAEVLRALELGAVDHVAKPFSVAVLMQRVRQALAGNSG
jgi:diguanylate cyclase (GGDEF)-like protein